MNFSPEEINKIENSEELFTLLLSVMEKLRSEQGCVWDREQDHGSLKNNLVEETYEAVESIENHDWDSLKEELGDLLLQVVFHSQIGKEEGNFNINDVLKGIINKLVRRHPHVFGCQQVDSSREVLENWEVIKKKERKQKNQEDKTIFSGIPRILPALHYANEVQRRAARLGFDWDKPEQVLEKVKEETTELEDELPIGNLPRIEHEIGDLLFSVVNLSRKLGLDGEYILKESTKKFTERFNFMEEYAAKNNMDFKSLPLTEKDKLWEIAKKSL
ncbi:MAG: nucleoside triphosphate pyrophosphohydrolase [Actinomycetota bacterium]|nr:nucleoside triphosphate pyrophosphohydrolase [Actinomycetota bacterium]